MAVASAVAMASFSRNFVSVNELPAVLAFMKYTPDQISGFCTDMNKASVFEEFCAKLRAYDEALAESSLTAMPRPKHLDQRSQKDWRERLCDDTSDTPWTLAGVVDTDELGDVPWS
ncbi:hypothetical protein MCAP1_002625 [Malassezia caprae]|uniref:Uncharacterized protein n=1 Tax=Malassezia caprae TaxID=1381934 RepID=A0AAF0E8R7_9BASI|nr:hypothetical protein MCAP1_002625 [Malassezia caprae]